MKISPATPTVTIVHFAVSRFMRNGEATTYRASLPRAVRAWPRSDVARESTLRFSVADGCAGAAAVAGAGGGAVVVAGAGVDSEDAALSATAASLRCRASVMKAGSGPADNASMTCARARLGDARDPAS